MQDKSNVIPFPSDLNRAARELEKAKIDEAQATKKRIAAENNVLAIMGVKPEGSTTHNTQEYKVVTTGKLNRKLIENELACLRTALPDAIFVRLINYKPSLNVSEVKYLRQNEPELYRHLPRVIKITEAKPSVSVEPLKRGK